MTWQESDCLIVVMKPTKVEGAKGAANSRFRSRSIDDTGGRGNQWNRKRRE
jgi:hypothetical protein